MHCNAVDQKVTAVSSDISDKAETSDITSTAGRKMLTSNRHKRTNSSSALTLLVYIRNSIEHMLERMLLNPTSSQKYKIALEH